MHISELLWPLLDVLVAGKIKAKLGGRLRAAICGGAALPNDVARVFLGLGVPLLQGYGLTETSPVISANLPDDNDPASVGVPLRDVELRIGHDGELLVRSPGVCLGYWRQAEASAALIGPDGWLHSGDKASIENNHIYITGRIKDILVMSNGEKVPPMDMELAISLSPVVDQALVIGEGQPFLAAILVLNPEGWAKAAGRLGLDADDESSLRNEKLADSLLREISGHLKDFPGYAKVRRVILTLDAWTVDNGLLTPTLKVKRARVLDRFSDEIAALYGAGER